MLAPQIAGLADQRSAWTPEEALSEARRILDDIDALLADPIAGAERYRAMGQGFAGDDTLQLDGVDPDIKLFPKSKRFENSDFLRYAVIGGAVHHLLGGAHLPDMDLPRPARDFTYPLGGQPGQAVTVALFADYGKGLPHAVQMARHMARSHGDSLDHAIHPGDVYYGGKEQEYEEYMKKPLRALLKKTKLFNLPVNHDLYSGAKQYLGFLRWLREKAIDYGSTDVPALWSKDLAPFVEASDIDLWFWGNVHHCALYSPGGKRTFVGSCIGHGGFPYKRIAKRNGQRFVARAETRSRYHPKRMREDMGNIGWCKLHLLPDGTAELEYIDWRNHSRCTAVVARGATGMELRDVRPVQ